jgi:hypothetical protein
MSEPTITTASIANRRRNRRHAVSGLIRVECRKGHLGLGRNLAIKALDISESGARMIVAAPFSTGDDVELLLTGAGVPKPVKRLGKVVWAVPVADGTHAIGVNFEKLLRYAELVRFAKGSW